MNKMKLSTFAKQEGISYRQALSFFNNGDIMGIKIISTGTILVEGWDKNRIENNQENKDEK